jgi:CheY-specific phosphatase CheX
MTKDQLEKAIQEALIQSSHSRLKTFCQVDDIKLNPKLEIAEAAHCPDMVLILLSGPEIHLTFKMFFNSEKARFLIEKTYGDINFKNEVSKYSVDAMKEVANLVVGHMKILLEKSDIKSEISLPIALRGYDELFFKDRKNDIIRKWHWEMEYENQQILFTGLMKLNLEKEGVEFVYEDESSSLEFF